MINLMPPSIKEERDFGRKNVILIKWMAQTTIAFGTLVVFIIAGIAFMYKAQGNAESNKIAISKSMTTEKLDETKKAYSEFASNIKTVNQILSKQILYSSLLQQIGAITPSGAILNSISISSTDNALDLSFTIETPEVAPVLQLNLQDKQNKLFEKADIIQVNCQQQSLSKCTTLLRAEYKKTQCSYS